MNKAQPLRGPPSSLRKPRTHWNPNNPLASGLPGSFPALSVNFFPGVPKHRRLENKACAQPHAQRFEIANLPPRLPCSAVLFPRRSDTVRWPSPPRPPNHPILRGSPGRRTFLRDEDISFFPAGAPQGGWLPAFLTASARNGCRCRYSRKFFVF